MCSPWFYPRCSPLVLKDGYLSVSVIAFYHEIPKTLLMNYQGPEASTSKSVKVQFYTFREKNCAGVSVSALVESEE